MSQTLYPLQIVRAAAATIVVAFHAQGELHHRGLDDRLPDLTLGAFGVDLFFVVSGFIMVHASERLFGRPAAAWPFLARRVVRIAPLYWLFTIVFTLVAIRLGQIPGHMPASVLHIVASFLFLPASRPEDGASLPVYALGWTLNYEMFFYACFAAVLGLRRQIAVAVLSAGLIGLVIAGRFMALPWPLAFWSNTLLLEFVFGLWLGLAHGSGWRLPHRIGIPLAIAAFVGMALAVQFADPFGPWRGLIAGLPAAIIVTQAIGTRAPGTSRPARAAIRLGDASYSLYLVHSALFLVCFEVFAQTGGLRQIPATAYFVLLVCGSMMTALLLYRRIERPLTRRLQQALKLRRVRVDPMGRRIEAGSTSDYRPG